MKTHSKQRHGRWGFIAKVEVEEVEIDSQYGDLIIHLNPGWCWEEQGVHTRGYPPEDKDMIQEDIKHLVEPCYCEDCQRMLSKD